MRTKKLLKITPSKVRNCKKISVLYTKFYLINLNIAFLQFNL